MDFRPAESEVVVRRAVREFAERELAPHRMEWDEAQRFPVDLLPQLAELARCQASRYPGATGIRGRRDVGG